MSSSQQLGSTKAGGEGAEEGIYFVWVQGRLKHPTPYSNLHSEGMCLSSTFEFYQAV